MRLELVKSKLRRYVAAGIVESVVRRAIFSAHVEPLRMTSAELELVVAKAVVDLRRMLKPQVLSTLVMEMTEVLANASDDCESEPGSVPQYSATMRVARHF